MTALLGLAPSLIACDSAETKASDGAMGVAGGAKTSGTTGGAGGASGSSTSTATGGGGGASTTGSTGGAGGASTGTATGGAGGASSTNKEDCDVYDDEPSGGTVTVRFRNESGQPVYLPAGCKSLQYGLTYLDGEATNVTYEGEMACVTICSDQKKYSGSIRNCFDCTATTFLLEPGATREATWDGVGRYSDGWSMPWYCYPKMGYPGGFCERVVTAPEGNYRIDALGYAECDGCACDDEGACTGTPAGAQALATPVTMSFPAETVVEVVFDACAFGCPDP